MTIDVRANDSDPDGDALTVVAVTQPAGARGVVTLNPDGTVAYTQLVYATGVETFTYTVADGRGGFATATVTVTLAIPPAAAIRLLAAQVVGLGLDAGRADGLLGKLDAAAAAIDRGRTTAAVGQLGALVNSLEAVVRGGHAAADAVDPILRQLQLLIDELE